jgi:hypothetical protein
MNQHLGLLEGVDIYLMSLVLLHRAIYMVHPATFVKY